MDKKELTIGGVIKKYVTLRDKLTAWQRKRDEEEKNKKAELEVLEMWLLEKTKELGVESFKTEYGTAYRSTEEHYRIRDWSSFIEFVKKTDNYSLLQKRVTKTAAKDVHIETGEIPAGLDYFQEYKVNVRRPTSGIKKEKGGE